MNDEELLNYVEAKVIEKMLDGCEIDDHLGYKKYDVGAWSVSFRADTLSRLIDMARKSKRTWVGLTDEDISEIVRGTHNTGSFVYDKHESIS